jgi:branched-chain amino acid transport system substrate-binding protein
MTRAGALVALLAAVVVACGGEDGGERPNAAVSAPAPSPLETCSRVYYEGEGRPDVLIATDMPLQGAYANDGIQGTRAVRIAMQQRGYRAGSHTVGYVSCDQSTPKEAYTSAKCRRSGRAYAAVENMVGVIGPFFSGCAIHMMPVLNRAGLAEVGPGNTYVGLTRAGPGIPADQPERFRPTGRRTFVRLAAPDDLQGRAHVKLVTERGERSAYVLHDGVDAYGLGAAAGFRDAAVAAGVEILGFETWDPEASDYSELVRRIDRSGAEGVFLGGYVLSNTGRLLRQLRATLGADIPLMTTEGMLPVTVLRARAGDAAEGLLVTLSSVATEKLEGAGKEFLAQFRKELNQDPCCYSVHVAQATHVLLDAIAASDGSRESITRALLDVEVSDGIIGDFSFDENGDVTPPLVSVYRITDGQQKLFDVVENP